MSTVKTNSIVLAATLFIATAACPQTPAQDAPIPVQIAQAKTAFLSNTCELAYEDCRFAYNMMYSALTTWGHYTLVTKPEDADIVLQVRLFIYDSASHLQLAILDEHTHFTLWDVNEWIDPNDSHSAITYQAAANRIIKDLEVLTKPGAMAAPTQKYEVPRKH